MTTKHTPAPWKTRKGFSSDEIEIFRPNPKIKKPFKPTEFATVRIDEDTKESVAESRANARLISAAPDLLECLIHLTERDWFKEGVTGEVVCGLDADKVRGAVLKAIGQNIEKSPDAGEKGKADAK